MADFKHKRLLLLSAVPVFLGVCFNLAFGSRPIVELLDVLFGLREVNVVHLFLNSQNIKRTICIVVKNSTHSNMNIR